MRFLLLFLFVPTLAFAEAAGGPEHSIFDILTIEPQVLIMLAMIVAIECIGIISWIKEFDDCAVPKNDCKVCKRCIGAKKRYAIWAIIACILCGVMNTSAVPNLVSTIYDIIFLGLAIKQLATEAVVKGLPKFIDRLFDKADQIVQKKQEDAAST
jgi:hypothetical protein